MEEVEEARAVAVQRHHLVVGRALGHGLDQHLQKAMGGREGYGRELRRIDFINCLTLIIMNSPVKG